MSNLLRANFAQAPGSSADHDSLVAPYALTFDCGPADACVGVRRWWATPRAETPDDVVHRSGPYSGIRRNGDTGTDNGVDGDGREAQQPVISGRCVSTVVDCVEHWKTCETVDLSALTHRHLAPAASDSELSPWRRKRPPVTAAPLDYSQKYGTSTADATTASNVRDEAAISRHEVAEASAQILPMGTLIPERVTANGCAHRAAHPKVQPVRRFPLRL